MLYQNCQKIATKPFNTNPVCVKKFQSNLINCTPTISVTIDWCSYFGINFLTHFVFIDWNSSSHFKDKYFTPLILLK